MRGCVLCSVYVCNNNNNLCVCCVWNRKRENEITLDIFIHCAPQHPSSLSFSAKSRPPEPPPSIMPGLTAVELTTAAPPSSASVRNYNRRRRGFVSLARLLSLYPPQPAASRLSGDMPLVSIVTASSGRRWPTPTCLGIVFGCLGIPFIYILIVVGFVFWNFIKYLSWFMGRLCKSWKFEILMGLFGRF